MFVNCQICGANQGKVLLTKSRENYVSTWIECSSCKSAHINPYPDEEQLKDYYNNDYTKMDFLSTDDWSVNHRLRYSNEYQDIIDMEYALSLRDLEIDIYNGPLKFGKILDFGCANGVFLKYLLSIGYDKDNIFGCDISPKMLADAAKFTDNVFLSGDVQKYKDTFDLVTLWDVIEHIYDPREWIKNIVASLKVGGELLIQTPNYGLLASLYNEDFMHFIVMEHINLFSRSALINFIESLEMRIIKAGSFGANISADDNQASVKLALDRAAKVLDFGSTQILRFIKV